MRIIPVLASLLLFALLMAAGRVSVAHAQLPDPGASAWVDKGHSRMRLVSASAAVGKAETLRLGLEVELKDDWKIYWRSPGDAGFPPEIDWTGSTNLADAAFRWPVPERFSVLGIETVGYKHAVLLPIDATLVRPGDPLLLRATVDYLICSDICVPDQASFSLALPPGPLSPAPSAHLISQWESRVPATGESHGLTVDEAVIEEGGVVRVAVSAEPPITHPTDLVLEAPSGLRFATPAVTLSDDGRHAVLRARAETLSGDGAADLVGQDLLALVTAGPDRGVEIPVNTTAAVASAGPVAVTTSGAGAPSAATGGSLPAMLGIALLGGLILNLMPCVLPVLSLKVLGLVGHGGGSPRRARFAFLATSAGILASFLALAGLAVGLKAAGAAVGWGIQFQQPLFLVFMVVLLTLFAANLWGLFDIPLPSLFGGLGGRGGGDHGGLAGHFVTGAFATLLATPCSAPFLGTAVGFALAGSTADTLGIFAALGVGMALPYLAVAAAPSLATRLPRPGAWMIRLKMVLGLAMAGTAVWLLTVLTSQVGGPAAAAVGLAMVALLAILGLAWRLDSHRPLFTGIALALGAGAFALPGLLHDPAAAGDAAGRPMTVTEGAITWQPFDQAALAARVAAGETVLVDVTADWCVTCQVNKATVLTRAPVADLLGPEGLVVPMRADWTRPNDEIAGYLASFGRFGIPFNAVYGPGAPEGVVLPELLSSSRVTEAVARASGAARTAGESQAAASQPE